MPISCLLPISMPYISRTNPIFCSTKQTQILCHPLFTKYDDPQHTATTTRVLQSVQKPRFRVTGYANLKPDCYELENENNKDDDPLRMVSALMEAQKKKKLLAVVIGAVSVCHSYKALAASGGVMGGDSFSSYSSSSDSSWSSSSSSDESSWSSSSPSPSPSSSSYSSSSPSSSSDDSSWSSPSDADYNSKPSRPSRSTTTSSKSTECKYTASTSVAPEITSTKTEASSKEGLGVLIVMVSILGIALFCAIRRNTPQDATRVTHENTPQKTRVIKFQVALLGSARSFQRDINQIAKVADTSSRRGFKNILTESLLALTRHSAYWESSHLSVYKEQCIKDGEKRFGGISFEERSKFDQETLVNLGSFKREQKLRQQLDEPSHDYIVVTFIVAVLGILELPTPKSRSDLTAIVQKLISIHEKDILAVQVLWTPQDEEDTLSSERVLKDYPLLQPL